WGDFPSPRVCINPDESPPFIVVRMLHEYIHASNRTLGELHSNYRVKKAAWIAARNASADGGAAAGKAPKDDLIALRKKLDVERYLDEHRAYAMDVKGARAVVASAPDYFCNLWIPSHRFKPPIRYPSAYAPLDARDKSDAF